MSFLAVQEARVTALRSFQLFCGLIGLPIQSTELTVSRHPKLNALLFIHCPINMSVDKKIWLQSFREGWLGGEVY